MNLKKWWYESKIKDIKRAIPEYEKALKKITPNTKLIRIFGTIYLEPYKGKKYIIEDLKKYKKELKKSQQALKKVI